MFSSPSVCLSVSLCVCVYRPLSDYAPQHCNYVLCMYTSYFVWALSRDVNNTTVLTVQVFELLTLMVQLLKPVVSVPGLVKISP